MTPSIRPATPHDVPEMVALLLQGAQERSALDGLLWRLAPDAPARVDGAVRATLDGAGALVPEQWLVAEQSSRDRAKTC